MRIISISVHSSNEAVKICLVVHVEYIYFSLIANYFFLYAPLFQNRWSYSEETITCQRISPRRRRGKQDRSKKERKGKRKKEKVVVKE